MPAIIGKPRIREGSSQYHAGRPSGAETKIATTITPSRKLVPPRGGRGGEGGGGGGRQRIAPLVEGDLLVPAPGVLNPPPQVAQAADRDDVADEDRGAENPLDEPEQERRAKLVLDQAGRAHGDDEE